MKNIDEVLIEKILEDKFKDISKLKTVRIIINKIFKNIDKVLEDKIKELEK